MNLIHYVLAALLLGCVIGYSFRRYREHSFQNAGEALVSRVVRGSFHSPDFHLLNHVTLKDERGTTQIDHILVSRFGVFVIETKNYSGWIFGNATQATWTQVLFYQRFKFQNPIHQNFRHVRAVQSLLDFLPPNAVKSLVVFAGQAEFKSDVPAGVIYISNLIEYLQSVSHSEVMSLNRLQFCVGRLETMRLAISGETDLEHVEGLQRRFGDDD